MGVAQRWRGALIPMDIISHMVITIRVPSAAATPALRSVTVRTAW
nr:hypothetical protein [Rhodococcus sp. 15-649-1-2]